MKPDQYAIMYHQEHNYWWFRAKRLFVASLLPKNNPHWRILDIGCGTGATSIFLDNWGKVTRIEPAKEAVQWLKKRKIKYIESRIETFKYPKNHYDLICLLDVLYHQNIKDDRKVIKIAKNALKKGGYLLITDSALPWLASNHDKKMMARERYYLSEIVNKIRALGFAIEKQSYIFFFTFPFLLVVRLVNKFFDFPTITPFNQWLNRFFYNLCQFESLLLPYVNFPIGSSIVIKAKKI